MAKKKIGEAEDQPNPKREAVAKAIEVLGKKAEAAAMALSEETEEGLWLWEVLNELEATELAPQNEPGARRHDAGLDRLVR